MRSSRKRFISGTASALAALGIVRLPAGAAEFSYKVATSTPPVPHPVTARATEAAQKTLLESQGRLDITVYPNNILGGDAAVIGQARMGAIEMLLMNDSVLMTNVPVVGVNSIPFAFKDDKEVWSAIDGSLGKYTRNAIAKGNVNLVPFDKVFDAGFREISNYVRPLKTPADLKGMKIRVQNAPVIVEAFRALGTTPTSIDGHEIYTALQTHLVDGGDVTLVSVETQKFYEVQRYLSMTNHQWQGYTMLANADAWQRLPAGLRDIAERNFNAAAVQSRTDVARLEQSLKAKLTDRGLLINEVDIPSFRAVLRAAGLYAKWRDEFGADVWRLLERAVGRLG